jgi:dimeric dUTPase (all-alpha-NTP-PPase superfamily)
MHGTIMNKQLEIFTFIATKQHQLNTLTKPDWLINTPNYDLAALVELFGEAIDHTPWKWWKAGKLEKDRLFLELIDVLHFTTSTLLTKFDTPTVSRILSDSYNYAVKEYAYLPDSINQKNIEVFITQIAFNLLTGATTRACQYLFTLINGLGFTLEDIFVSYAGKNLLNSFRQANGYKQGTYTKIWDTAFDGDNVVELEDNDFLQAFLKDKMNSLSIDDLVNQAEQYLEFTYISKGYKK